MLLAVVADDLVPREHPIRAIRRIVDRALAELSPLFDEMYAPDGRPSIPPEHLLKSLVLIALYSIRSERQFCERLQYDLLFKWFLDLNIADPAFNPSSFSKNRERLLAHDAVRRFFIVVRDEAKRRHLLSSDHFTVDGTLLEA
jgi:transposase